MIPEPFGLACCLALSKTPISGRVVFVGDFEELSAVLDSDVAPLGKKLAIEVLTGENPRCKVGASGSVGSGESDRVMVTGVVCVLLVGGLAVVDGDDGSLDGGVVGVEEVHDAVSGPDGVDAHGVFSLSLSELTLPCWVGEVKSFLGELSVYTMRSPV